MRFLTAVVLIMACVFSANALEKGIVVKNAEGNCPYEVGIGMQQNNPLFPDGMLVLYTAPGQRVPHFWKNALKYFESSAMRSKTKSLKYHHQVLTGKESAEWMKNKFVNPASPEFAVLPAMRYYLLGTCGKSVQQNGITRDLMRSPKQLLDFISQSRTTLRGDSATWYPGTQCWLAPEIDPQDPVRDNFEAENMDANDTLISGARAFLKENYGSRVAVSIESMFWTFLLGWAIVNMGDNKEKLKDWVDNAVDDFQNRKEKDD